MKIKVKYFDKDLERIEKISVGDLIDLRCSADITMKKGEFRLIPLGVAMELPKGYEAHVYPRSSTYKKHKILLTNSVGIIDNSYNGDSDMWCFPAYATEDTEIEKNTRICQFRIVENQPDIEFEEVEILGNDDRGGIGSTGEK